MVIFCILICSVEKYVKEIFVMGINIVDSFDIYIGIVDLCCELGVCVKEYGVVLIILVGWDLGSDLIVCIMFEVIVFKGIIYINFGLGMSMGYMVVVKVIDGVKVVLLMIIFIGIGIYCCMVYIELKDGYKFEEVVVVIKLDVYFVNDEIYVK